ncbi:MAG: TetR/AcrR family transcriptional regulator [Clostridia bacterium]|nr:TetR/AcrR family transcriptional regulator [Clostridia bacterium]
MENLVFKKDKRSTKTRSKIKTALMVLLKTKSPRDITICEITTLAHVNRNSFYTHYKTIHDVMTDIYESVFVVFSDIYNKYSYNDIILNPYTFMKELTLILIENSAFSEYVMFSKHSGTLVQDLIDNFTEAFYDKYIEFRQDANPIVPYVIKFLISGTVEIIFSWFKNGRKDSIEDILVCLSGMIKDGIVSARSIKLELSNK